MINLKGYIFAIVILLMQILFAFLFGFHSEYKYSPITTVASLNEPDRGNLEYYYPFFMDIHVMMFVGFGFLMTFLRRYSFSSVGFNFLLCAIALEWGLIIQGYLFDWQTEKKRFFIDLYSLIGSDFTSASILISMGAILGKVNLLQLVLMAFFEIPIQIVNKYISTKIFCASDAGESMYVHMFGAVFGLATAFVLHRRNVSNSKHESSRYTSDITAMIGTLFLFCFWPSFNCASVTKVYRIRAVVNTYVSISASVAGAFLMSAVLKRGKLEMVHVQNATLAGGIGVGTVAGSDIGLHGAVVIGTLAGMLSVLGFTFILPVMKKLWIHDTCGVFYLHGLPGFMSGVTGIIVSTIGDRSGYLDGIKAECLGDGTTRTGTTQAAFQAAALGLTFGLAAVGGLLVGILLRIPIFAQNDGDFDDEMNWHLPEDNRSAIKYESHHPGKGGPSTSF